MSLRLERLVPAHLRSLAPYVPGRPAEDVAREHGLERVVKLASNENPLGPSPRALRAVAGALAELGRYPDGAGRGLRAALAGRLGVEPERIALGNGSNEIITLLARLFVGAGEEAVVSEGAFAIYRLAVQAAGGVVRSVPMRGFVHDLEAMARAVGPATRLVFVGNPNNPTGTIFRRPEWERFLARIPDDVVVVCDEAYAEFVEDPDYPDAIREPDRHPLLVVVRTFSKAYGLAGLRVGYALAAADVIDLLDRIRDPFNVNALAQAAARAALEDAEHLERSRSAVRAGRRFLERVFGELGLAFVPGEANFLMVDVGDGGRVAAGLERRGVIVRPIAGYGFPRHVRITVGTPEENGALARALALELGIEPRADFVQEPLERAAP